MTIFGRSGSRTLSLEKFHVIPGAPGQRENALDPDEIVTEIRVPDAEGVRSATYEVRPRKTLDWPLAAAAVALTSAGGVVRSARIVLGHVAPIPWAVPEAEATLAGKTVTEQIAEAAGIAAVGKAKALSGNGYKIRLAKVAVKRAILAADGGGV